MKALILGLCVMVAGVVVLSFGINSLRMSNRAESWPTTEGTIVSSQCVHYHGWDEGSSYFTHVAYRYTVAGKSYPGDCIAFGYSGSGWQKPNQAIADKLSSAKTVQVRYDPENPAMAVLSHGLNGSIVMTLFIGSWLLIMTAAVWIHVFRSRRCTGVPAYSWGVGGFRLTVHGIGFIVLLAVLGLVMASTLASVIDYGILNSLVTD